jgi:adenylosuccinate synthase
MKRGKLNFVVGGQYGSEGKGKVAGYLARKFCVDYSICSFSSQAGHTFYDDDGTKYLVQQVPMAACNPDTKLLISQGAIIDLDILRNEIKTFNLSSERLRIHPKAIVIEQKHKDAESLMLNGPKHIASTCKGNGAAMSDFVFRHSDLKTMDMLDEFKDYLGDTRTIINDAIAGGALCMAECAQGFSLDIYQGFYPYVTSRGCTVAAELARIGVQPQLVGNIYGVYRTYPIRVGNIDNDKGEIVGFSGGGFSDQKEISWEMITEWSKSNTPILERTTVTNRVRRVFTFSYDQFILSVKTIGVTNICIMFADYINTIDYGKDRLDKLSDETREWMEVLEQKITDGLYGMDMPSLALIGTGPNESQIVNL